MYGKKAALSPSTSPTLLWRSRTLWFSFKGRPLRRGRSCESTKPKARVLRSYYVVPPVRCAGALVGCLRHRHRRPLGAKRLCLLTLLLPAHATRPLGGPRRTLRSPPCGLPLRNGSCRRGGRAAGDGPGETSAGRWCVGPANPCARRDRRARGGGALVRLRGLVSVSVVAAGAAAQRRGRVCPGCGASWLLTGCA